jgi:hypothetical protein
MKVIILYRGKEKAVLMPIRQKKRHSVKEHPFCGMFRDQETPVKEIMTKLRGDRYDDI